MHGKGRWHWLGKTLLAIAALALLAVASVFALRLIIPTESDHAALAWLEKPHEVPAGSNAFAALWALPYDLPADAIAPLVAEDLRQAGERDALAKAVVVVHGDSKGMQIPRFKSAFDARAQAFDEKSLGSLCGTPRDCFAAARHDPAAFEATLSSDPALAERALALADHQLLLERFPPDAWGPSLANRSPLAMTAIPIALGLHATHAGVAAGLGESCRQLAGWRRFAAQPASIVQRMLNVAMVAQLADIAAGLLSELPHDADLPADCRSAFAAPLPEESDFCPTLPFEFQLTTVTLDRMREQAADADAAAHVRFLHALLVDDDLARIWLARNHQLLCTAARTAADAGQPIDRSALAEQLKLPAHQCAAAWVTCTLASIPPSGYAQYADRQIDHAARLRLLAAVLWLRDNTDPALPLAERLTQLPDSLRGGAARNLRVGEDGASLAISLHHARPEPEWAVPVGTPSGTSDARAAAVPAGQSDQGAGLRL
jgi:hypothetical protein